MNDRRPDRLFDAGVCAFHPLTVLLVSSSATIAVALLIDLHYQGPNRRVLLYYFAPIGFPFVAYLFDRAQRWRSFGWTAMAVEVPTIALAVTRAFVPVPLVSGHALFLTYAMLTVRSHVARWSAALVMAEVYYIKVFIWHDPTLVGGLLVGPASASLSWKVTGVREPGPCAVS